MQNYVSNYTLIYASILVGYESHDRAVLSRRNLPRQKYIFLSRFTKRCNSIIFSFYHLQIVLLTTANNKIHKFSRNNDLNGYLTCVRGMKAPAAPCRATCVSGSFTLISLKLITETFDQGVFLLEMWARVILCGCFWHAMEYILLKIIMHTLNRPFFMRCYSWTINWSVKIVFTIRLHHNIIKGPLLN